MKSLPGQMLAGDHHVVHLFNEDNLEMLG